MLDALLSESPSRSASILARYGGEELASERAVSMFVPTSSSIFEEWRHPGEAVKNNPGKRAGELFKDMKRRGLRLGGFVGKRRDAVAALPRTIKPADGSREAAEIADFVRVALGGIRQRVSVVQAMAETSFPGLTVFELFWGRPAHGPLAGQLVIVDIKDRPIDRFSFSKSTGEIHVRKAGAAKPEPAPPGKFWELRYGTRDCPWGSGLADDLYWSSELERVFARAWGEQLYRFGAPWVDVGFPRRRDFAAGASQSSAADSEIGKIFDAVRRLRAGGVIAHPDDETIKLIEAANAGGAHGQALQLLAAGQAVAVLGEVGTSGLSQGPGSYAMMSVLDDVRYEKVVLDAHFCASAENDGPIAWLVHLNFGPDAPVPIAVWETVEAQDRESRQKGITGALGIGLTVSEHSARLAFGVPEPRPGEPILEPRAATAPAPPTNPSLSSRGGRLALAAGDGEPDFEAIAAQRLDTLDHLADAFLPSTFAHTGQIQAELSRLFDQGRVADGSALSQLVARIDVVGPAEAVTAALVHACGFALRALRDDGGPGLLSLASDVPFAQATTPQAAVTFWERLLSLPKDLFSLLLPRLRRLAFAVQGVQDATVLQSLQALLGRAVAEQMGGEQFTLESGRLFEQQGITPLSDWHARLVWENAVRTASHAAQWERTVGNPAAHRLFPYLRVSTSGDEAVRERSLHNHRIVGGFVAAIGHSFWQTWWPIFGHVCRCYINVITKSQAARLGYTGAEPVGPWPIDPRTGQPAQPDPGFAGAPTFQRLAEDEEDRFTDFLQAANTTGSADLRAALQLLARALGLGAFA